LKLSPLIHPSLSARLPSIKKIKKMDAGFQGTGIGPEIEDFAGGKEKGNEKLEYQDWKVMGFGSIRSILFDGDLCDGRPPRRGF
jgi:hypothetical protein